QMYSAFASASDSVLGTDSTNIENVLAAKIPQFRLWRTIPSDFELMQRTVEELKRRGVWKKPSSGRIVLLAELDTVYTTALAHPFIDAAHNRNHGRNGPGTPGGDGQADGQIETIFYPEGIDGKVPTDRKDDKNSQSGASPEKADAQPKEATEGANQSDYLRRL